MFEAAGHDATSVLAQELQGEPDSRVAEVCLTEARALVTLDVGFADIRAYPPSEHAGIIVMRLRDQSVPYLRAMTGRVLQLLVDCDVERTLWVVEDDRVRFRR